MAHAIDKFVNMKTYTYQISSRANFNEIGNVSRFTNSIKIATKLQKQGGYLWEHNPFKAGGQQDEFGNWHFVPAPAH